jgi:ribonuclease PH
VEVQATGEGGPFPAAHLGDMLALAQKGLKEIARIQEETLAPWLPLPW